MTVSVDAGFCQKKGPKNVIREGHTGYARDTNGMTILDGSTRQGVRRQSGNVAIELLVTWIGECLYEHAVADVRETFR